MTKESRAPSFSERVKRGEIPVLCTCPQSVCAPNFAFIESPDLAKDVTQIPVNQIPNCMHGRMIPSPKSQGSDSLF